jgi:hypothetical protein
MQLEDAGASGRGGDDDAAAAAAAEAVVGRQDGQSWKAVVKKSISTAGSCQSQIPLFTQINCKSGFRYLQSIRSGLLCI